MPTSRAVLRDPRFGAGRISPIRSIKTLGDGPLAESYSLWFLFQDPPDHTRLRGLVSKAFTPRAVDNLRHKIDDVVEHFSTGVRGAAVVRPDEQVCIPGAGAGDLRAAGGAGEQIGAASREWSAALAKGLDILAVPDPESIHRGNAAADGLTAYFRELVGLADGGSRARICSAR